MGVLVNLYFCETRGFEALDYVAGNQLRSVPILDN